RELPLEQETGGGRLQMLRDRSDRGVRAVRGRERVVHVAVSQLGEGPREAVVVGFFFCVESQILQKQDFSRLERAGPLQRRSAHAVGRQLDLLAEKLLEPRGDGAE